MAEKSRIIERKEVKVVLPVVKAPSWLQGFIDFVREQGVVGVAVAFVLGVASKSVVDSLVTNIINPIVGLVGGGGGLASKAICIKHVNGVCQAGSKLGYGAVISQLINLLIVAAVVYFVVKGLKLDKLDKKKE